MICELIAVLAVVCATQETKTFNCYGTQENQGNEMEQTKDKLQDFPNGH